MLFRIAVKLLFCNEHAHWVARAAKNLPLFFFPPNESFTRGCLLCFEPYCSLSLDRTIVLFGVFVIPSTKSYIKLNFIFDTLKAAIKLGTMSMCFSSVDIQMECNPDIHCHCDLSSVWCVLTTCAAKTLRHRVAFPTARHNCSLHHPEGAAECNCIVKCSSCTFYCENSGMLASYLQYV